MFRVTVLTNVLPAPTDSGGRISVYSLGESLTRIGCEISYVYLGAVNEDEHENFRFPLRVLSASQKDILKSVSQLGKVLADAKPDLVWIFNTQSWDYFRNFRHNLPHILYVFDPLWTLGRLRRNLYLATSKSSRKYLTRIFGGVNDWVVAKKELRSISEASTNGVTTAFSHNTLNYWKTHGADLKLSLVPMIDNGLRRKQPNPEKPVALLLGNMNSIHTRLGLQYFFKEVWPQWCKSPPLSTVRVVGGGKMPSYFNRPEPSPYLDWVGYAPSLDEEWEGATALLVPVPILYGARSRIIEAWSRGVPIIAHPASEDGLPMLKDKENYLAACSAEDWISKVRHIESTPSLAESLIRKGRETYQQYFSLEASFPVYKAINGLALEKFKQTSK